MVAVLLLVIPDLQQHRPSSTAASIDLLLVPDGHHNRAHEHEELLKINSRFIGLHHCPHVAF